jgi:hypothetical protein
VPMKLPLQVTDHTVNINPADLERERGAQAVHSRRHAKREAKKEALRLASELFRGTKYEEER